MQNPATCFAAKMKTASGGHSSHPDRCAWPLKTAQSLAFQILDHVRIASVERDCKSTKTNELHWSHIFYPFTVALQGSVMPHTNARGIMSIPMKCHILKTALGAAMITHFAISTPSRSLMTIACSLKTAVHVSLATPVPQEKKGALSDTTVRQTQPV